MYNGGFGAYPQNDMGVNSYFGESDTNFFGDTSNDSFFGEGCGFTGVGNGEFFNESVGFSTDGSEVISEAYGMEYDNSDMFMESSGDMFMETKVPVRRIKKADGSTSESTNEHVTKKASSDDLGDKYDRNELMKIFRETSKKAAQEDNHPQTTVDGKPAGPALEIKGFSHRPKF